jgi:hypothetical protein
MTQDDLEINSLTQELIAAKRAAAGRSVPDSRLNKQIQDIQNAIQQRKSATLSTPGMKKGGVVKPVWDKARPKDLGKSKPLSPKQKTKAKAMASKADRPYPNLVDNMRAAKMATGGMTKKQTAKVGKVMGEFKAGTLHSGKGGPVVKNSKQGIAIALSEASKLKKKK